MFYVKTRITDECAISTEINSDNVYTHCSECGMEFVVDLEAILNDGGCLIGSSCLCAKCSEKHLIMQELLRQNENA